MYQPTGGYENGVKHVIMICNAFKVTLYDMQV
jgi:hypothetical protein